jgi:hypothetical protein
LKKIKRALIGPVDSALPATAPLDFASDLGYAQVTLPAKLCLQLLHLGQTATKRRPLADHFSDRGA